MEDTILVLNAGSSSVKFQLFAINGDDGLSLKFQGQLEGIGVKPHLIAQAADGHKMADKYFSPSEGPTVQACMPRLLRALRDQVEAFPIAIGHRVVFGGTDYAAPVKIDDLVFKRVNALVPLMPLHLPPALAVIQVIRERRPEITQVAVFDTGFHRQHDEVLERLPLPDAFFQEGVRRYGYHGISYEYVAKQLPKVAPEIARGRVVVAHLGSGCSMCAMVDGRSVEATMGFSALDGLPMGTRPGRLDPGVILYLLQVKKMSVEQIEKLLYKECGLKGLSGISNDMRELLASTDPRAKMALDYFSLHCARAIADLASVMGGIDGVVFTAGVGERAASIRAAICSRLAWLGMEIDDAANTHHGPRISSRNSRIACYVIPTNEELMIAQHTLKLIKPDLKAILPAAAKRPQNHERPEPAATSRRKYVHAV